MPFAKDVKDCKFCKEEIVKNKGIGGTQVKIFDQDANNAEHTSVTEVEELDYEDDIIIRDDILVMVNTDEFAVEEVTEVPTELRDMGQKSVANNRRKQTQPVSAPETEPVTKAVTAVTATPAHQFTEQELQILQNLHLESYVNKLLDARIQKVFAERGGEGIMDHNNEKQKKDQVMIKSPSDTPIYVPVLAKESYPVQNLIGSITAKSVPKQKAMDQADKQCDISNIVSDFVDTVQLQQQTQQQIDSAQPSMSSAGGDSRLIQIQKQKQATEDVEQREARRRSEHVLVEAEKFRAAITEPKGWCQINDSISGQVVQIPLKTLEMLQTQPEQIINGNKFDTMNDMGPGLVRGNVQVNAEVVLPNIGQGVSNDDFFHLTCFIEPNLIHKIEKGEFVELEKLIPKDKAGPLGNSAGDGRLEWVQKDGGTYLVPANNKDTKITGIRKWEQAFRAYATIYCGANPQRAKEIWQYISVINTAAAAYSWDSVYNYDITFRHLMAFNPNRSWAVTYNQMWNLSMQDPLPKGSYQRQSQAITHSSSGHPFNKRKEDGKGNGRRKSDYCWNFNRGVPCKFGNRCKFIKRCSYCDSPNHGVNVCIKAKKRDSNGGATEAAATK